MSDDNLLGAPTQGLGQTVTFAPEEDNGVPQLRPEVLADMQGGVRGGNVQAQINSLQRTEIDRNNYFNADVLISLASKANDVAFGEKYQDNRQKSFLGGMQRAMAGEAVADIAAEQPWYSKLFGKSDVVEGARQYASNAQISDMMTGIEAAMPELARMSQGETQGFFDKALSSALTGDAVTDVATTQAFVRQSPALMKAATKAQVGYMQRRASDAQMGAWGSAVTRLQSAGQAFADGTYNQEDFLKLKADMALTFQMPAGQDEDVYEKNLVKTITSAAYAGNLHAVNTMKELGVVGALNPDSQTAVMRAVDHGETIALSKARMAYVKEISGIEAEARAGKITGNQVLAAYDSINKQASRVTGVSKPLIDSKEIQGDATAAISQVYQAEEANLKAATVAAAGARKEEDKILKEAQAIQSTVTIMATGHEPVAATGDQIKAAYEEIGKLTPAQATGIRKKLFDQNPTQVDSRLAQANRGRAESAVSSQNPDQIEGIYADYAAMRQQGTTFAAAYYGGGELAAKLETYHMNRGDGNPGSRQLAFQKAFVDPLLKTKITDKAEVGYKKKLLSETSYMPLFGGGVTAIVNVAGKAVGIDSERIDMPTDQVDTLFKYIAPKIELWEGKSPDAAKQALSEWKAEGSGTIIGGYPIRNIPGQSSIEAGLLSAGIPSDRVNSTFRKVLDAKLEQLDASDRFGMNLMRAPDADGVQRIFGTIVKKDGTVLSVMLDSNEIVARYKADNKPVPNVSLGNPDAPMP
jgi:hypothetical protein